MDDMHTVLFEIEGMKVFEAPRQDGAVVVKRYRCSRIKDADLLLKEALKQAQRPNFLWGALSAVVFGFLPELTASLVYEKFSESLPRDVIETDDRGTKHPPGLSAYRVERLLLHREKAATSLASSVATSQAVTVKATAHLNSAGKANAAIEEALAQARVTHSHNVRLLDIALTPYQSVSLHVCTVTEQLDKSLQQDLQERRSRDQSYEEGELLELLLHVTAGLVQAQTKVSGMQDLAHRNIRPDNLFRAFDGKWKLGGFGSGRKDRAAARRYLSPEERDFELNSHVDHFASDVFAVGVTLLELAKCPAQVDLTTCDVATLVSELQSEMHSLATFAFLKSLLLKMLKVTPSERPTAEQVHLAVSTHSSLFPPEAEADEESRWQAEVAWLRTKGESLALASALRTLARIHLSPQRLLTQSSASQAVSCAEESLSVYRTVLGECHPALAAPYVLLGQAYQALGRLSEAADSVKAALSIVLKERGKKSSDYASVLLRLSSIFRLMGKLPEAAESGRKALSIRKKLLGESHLDTAGVCDLLARIYSDMGQPTTALENAQVSLAVRHSCLGAEHADVAESHNILSTIFERQERLAVAIGHSEQSLSVRLAALGESHPSTAASRLRLSYLHYKTNRHKEALELGKRALQNLQEALGSSHPRSLSAAAWAAHVESGRWQLPSELQQAWPLISEG